MALAPLLFLLLQAVIHGVVTSAATAPAPKTVNITTIAANAQKESTLECWQLEAPLVASAAAGTAGAVFAQLGETTKTSWGIIPGKFDGGLHNAPAVQWVAFTAGKAVISLPNSTDTATIPGGRNGLILVTDTKNVSDVGHITKYPGKKSTIAFQIPLENNVVPPHTVLHGGACGQSEQNTGG